MIRKILVPLDGSILAEKALAYAEELAQKFEAELILVRVLQIVPEFMAGPRGVAFYKQVAEERAEIIAYLSEIVNQLRSRHLLVRSVVLNHGPAEDSIVALACQEAVDLIVMSTHGRSGVSRWMHGSVAGKVLHHAPCPVFLVRVAEAEYAERI